MSAIRELFVQLGFKVDLEKFKQFNNSINIAKQNFNNFASDVSKTVAPDLQNRSNEKLKGLLSYEDELQKVSSKERSEIKKLNSLEKQATREALREQKNKYAIIRVEEKSLLNLQRLREREQRKFFASQRGLGRTIKNLALSFGATFSVFSAFKSTLKDIEGFKSRRGKTFSVFSKKDLQISTTFAARIKQVSKNFAELRNGIVLKLMPAINELLAGFNKFWEKNKDIIKQNINQFIDVLVFSAKALGSALLTLKNVLDPLVNLIGGWGNALSVIVSISMVRWLVGVITALGGFVASTLNVIKIVKNFVIVLASLKVVLIAVRAAMTLLTANPIVAAITIILAGIASIMSSMDSWIVLWDMMKISIDAVVGKMKDLWDWIIKAKDALLNFPKSITTRVENAFAQSEFGKQNDGIGNAKYLMKDGLRVQDNAIDSAARNAITNNSTVNKKNVTFAPKNNFSVSINVPTGTNQGMAELISTSIKNELEKYTAYENEKFLISIGADR